jgi:hypothetical protein
VTRRASWARRRSSCTAGRAGPATVECQQRKKIQKQSAYRNGEVVAAGKLSDLANIPERCAHDDGVVAILLVVVEDALHALDARVIGRRVLLLGRCLVPVENAADEWRNEEGASLSCGNRLDEREHERQVAIDSMLRL